MLSNATVQSAHPAHRACFSHRKPVKRFNRQELEHPCSPLISSSHAVFRAQERAQMQIAELHDLWREGKTVLIGYSLADRRQFRLFWSGPAQAFMVGVFASTNPEDAHASSVAVTVLTLAMFENDIRSPLRFSAAEQAAILGMTAEELARWYQTEPWRQYRIEAKYLFVRLHYVLNGVAASVKAPFPSIGKTRKLLVDHLAQTSAQNFWTLLLLAIERTAFGTTDALKKGLLSIELLHKGDPIAALDRDAFLASDALVNHGAVKRSDLLLSVEHAWDYQLLRKIRRRPNTTLSPTHYPSLLGLTDDPGFLQSVIKLVCKGLVTKEDMILAIRNITSVSIETPAHIDDVHFELESIIPKLLEAANPQPQEEASPQEVLNLDLEQHDSSSTNTP